MDYIKGPLECLLWVLVAIAIWFLLNLDKLMGIG